MREPDRGRNRIVHLDAAVTSALIGSGAQRRVPRLSGIEVNESTSK